MLVFGTFYVLFWGNFFRFLKFCSQVKGQTADFSLKKLVNRAMDLYVKDEEFKSHIDEHENLQESGSQF